VQQGTIAWQDPLLQPNLNVQKVHLEELREEGNLKIVQCASQDICVQMRRQSLPSIAEQDNIVL